VKSTVVVTVARVANNISFATMEKTIPFVDLSERVTSGGGWAEMALQGAFEDSAAGRQWASVSNTRIHKD
jgi:hypothetical protein